MNTIIIVALIASIIAFALILCLLRLAGSVRTLQRERIAIDDLGARLADLDALEERIAGLDDVEASIADVDSRMEDLEGVLEDVQSDMESVHQDTLDAAAVWLEEQEERITAILDERLEGEAA